MSRIRRLDSRAADFQTALDDLLAWESVADADVQATVQRIVDDVRQRGDAALLEYTARFDRLEPGDASALEVPRERLAAALSSIDPQLRADLELAAERLRAYAGHQKVASWSYTEADGTLLGQQVTPLDRVGLYVPGGKAAYPSSVLMNAVPAKVAGVPELVMVVPAPGGELNELVLAAAAVAGVDRVFTVGGAQAVAALAYGTDTIPGVDKIVGPGNIYVAAAKRMVFGKVGIDMIAGPSEILVVCDGATDPDWVAMDLFSQAEHDEDAQAILVSPDAAFLDAVAASVERLLRPRWGRGDRQPHRPGAPRTVGRRSRVAAAGDPSRRGDLHGSLHRRGDRRLLRRAQPRAADLAHRAFLVAARGLRLPETEQSDQLFRRRCRDARRRRGAPGARRGADRPRPLRRIPRRRRRVNHDG